MNRQAIVGLFTIAGLVGLFAIFLVLANVGTQGRYKIGVHFKSAAGLHRGALVYESGVTVGVVDQTQLLPEDFTVEVVLAINNSVDIPRDARFVATAPLTGDVTVEIVPPAPAPRPVGFIGPTPVPAALALLPRVVLPLDQQPAGTNPATISDLLEQGQGQVHRLDRMLAQLEDSEPKLLATLQSTLENANELTKNGNANISKITNKLDTMMSTLSVAMDAGSKNLVDLSGELDSNVKRNSSKIDSLLANLNATSIALNQTVDSVRDLAKNPQLAQNLLDTTKGLAQTATTIGQITSDFHKVTGDPNTQAQLRDTVGNIDAATQKVNALLAQFGGKSSVYGVDTGATPAPGTRAPAGNGPAGNGPGGNVPNGTINRAPQSSSSPTPAQLPNILKSRLASAARDVLAIEVRVGELDRQPSGNKSSSPLLTNDRGPQTDINAVILPRGRTSLTTGANDIGAAGQTWNFYATESLRNDLQVGGGLMYSRLGVMARYDPGHFGIETRLYDPRHPTLDAYGNLKLKPGVVLFGGERDIINNGRRTVFGLQLQF